MRSEEKCPELVEGQHYICYNSSMVTISMILVLSMIGIGETVYLIRKRLRAERPICIIGDSCTTVLESKYNKLFLIPNDILGLLTYLLIFFLSLFYALQMGSIPLLVFGITGLVGIGCAASVMFSFIQWRFIKVWCFWCLMSAFTLWAMGIILLIGGI